MSGRENIISAKKGIKCGGGSQVGAGGYSKL